MKQELKAHIYEYTYMNCLIKGKSIKREKNYLLFVTRIGNGVNSKWALGILLGWWKCSNMNRGHECTTLSFKKPHCIGHLKRENSIVCKWYFSEAIKNKSTDTA